MFVTDVASVFVDAFFIMETVGGRVNLAKEKFAEVCGYRALTLGNWI